MSKKAKYPGLSIYMVLSGEYDDQIASSNKKFEALLYEQELAELRKNNDVKGIVKRIFFENRIPGLDQKTPAPLTPWGGIFDGMNPLPTYGYMDDNGNRGVKNESA